MHYPLRRGELLNLVAVFHSDRYEEGWDTYGDPQELYAKFNHARPEVRELLDLIESLADVGAVRPGTGRELELGPRHAARGCCSSHPAVPGPGRLHGDRGCGRPRRQGDRGSG